MYERLNATENNKEELLLFGKEIRIPSKTNAEGSCSIDADIMEEEDNGFG